MKDKLVRPVSIRIDKLTNSIQNVASGDSFETNVSPLTIVDRKLIKKELWLFDWVKELKDVSKVVYKLTVASNNDNIQGLISVEDRGDHVFMHLIESAKFNKGRSKVYVGVPGNLVAFACKLSKDKGYYGIVSFFAKTKLIAHYKVSLGAKVLFGNQMIIDEKNAEKLISKYFKD